MGNNVKIAAVGDLCLGDHYFSLGHGTAEKCRKKNAVGIADEIVQVLKRADISFCNVESPLSENSDAFNCVEKAVFRGRPEFAQMLSAAGFTLANIANNHICQHGEQAFIDSVKALNCQSIETIGHRSDKDYSSAPYVKKIKGLSIGFIGYSLVTEKYMPKQHLYASSSEHEILQDVIRFSQEMDVVIVSIHAGEEGVLLPQPEIIRLYRQVVDAGANIVLGHHPHVFQAIEKWNQGVICYSLGNFIFDLFWNPLLVQSALILLEIDFNKNISFEIIPVLMEPSYSISTLTGELKEIFFQRLHDSGNMLESLNADQYFEVFNRQLTEMEAHQLFFKGKYFINNFLKGNVWLKSQFIAGKLKDVYRSLGERGAKG